MRPSSVLQRLLLDSFPDALIITDVDGAILAQNPRARDLLAQQSQTPPSHLLPRFRSQEKAERLMAQALSTSGWVPGRLENVQSGERERIDLQAVREDNTPVSMLWRFHGKDSSSHVFHELNERIAYINRCLSEEQSLRKSTQDNYRKLEKVALELAGEIEHRLRVEKQLTTVLNAVAEGIVQVDDQGRIVTVNKALVGLLGYQPHELLNKPVEILLPPVMREHHVKDRQQFMLEPVSRPMAASRQLSARHRDGHMVPVEIGLNPVELDGVTHVVATVLDVTERLRQRQELLDKTQALERSNQELNDFAYIASHDLKEPLRGISNYAGFLLEDYEEKLDDEGRDMLRSLVRLSSRMEQLITELLHYSRLGLSQMTLEQVPVADMVREVLDTLAPRLEELHVRCEVDTELPVIQADRLRLLEVFLNLVSNAMKYNDKDDKWIRIGHYEEPDHIVFYVQDNGIGIAPAFQEKVFKIFKRLHTQDRFQGGTGVGLTIVKKIVERHGGRIWIESEEQVGTRFCFSLPIQSPDSAVMTDT